MPSGGFLYIGRKNLFLTEIGGYAIIKVQMMPNEEVPEMVFDMYENSPGRAARDLLHYENRIERQAHEPGEKSHRFVCFFS